MRLTNRVLPLLALPATLVVASDGALLGQFALQKVLQDGREVFGDYVDATSSSSSSSLLSSSSGSSGSYPSIYANWMAGLPDSVPLTQLNIPGTHDTATWNYSQETQDSLQYATRCDGTVPAVARAYRCQRKSIAESLESGIRFFDLRFALDPADARLVFWHSAALLSDLATVEDVLFGFYAWLERHRSETVILSFQYEHSTKLNASSDSRVQRALFDALTSPAARRYIHQSRGVVPKLGEVRGKIILFRRFDLDALSPAEEYEGTIPGLHMSPQRWIDNNPDFALVHNDSTNATAYIEDYYYPTTHLTVSDNIEAKFDAASKHLQKAAAGDYGSLFVTFTSGTHVDIIPPVFPEVMALGPGAESSHANQNDQSKEGVNFRLINLLKEMKGKRLGIVVIDFFEEPKGLIDLLLDF